MLHQGIDVWKAGRIARDVDCFTSLVSACSNLPSVLDSKATQSPTTPTDDTGPVEPSHSGSGLLDRTVLEEVLHEVRSTADGFNKPLFARVIQLSSTSGPSVLPVDSFSIWHIQVCSLLLFKHKMPLCCSHACCCLRKIPS